MCSTEIIRLKITTIFQKMTAKITQIEVEKMVRHWLATPVNSYLGSDYGFDKHALLFTPLTMNAADEVIAKLRRDVPVLEMFPSDSINLYSVPLSPDKLHFILGIGDMALDIM